MAVQRVQASELRIWSHLRMANSPPPIVKLISFTEGRQIEAQDSEDLWFPARIDKTERRKVLVSFDGWSSEWSEWIPKDSARLSEHRGWGTSKMPDDWQQNEEIVALDSSMQWCSAKVLHVAELSVMVHYSGQQKGRQVDEWIDKDRCVHRRRV